MTVVSNMCVVCGLVNCFSGMIPSARCILIFIGLSCVSEGLRGFVEMLFFKIGVETHSESSTIFSKLSNAVVKLGIDKYLV